MFTLDKEKEEALLYLNVMLDKRDEKNYSPPLDSGLLQERFRKLTPALSSVGGEGEDGAPALVTHFKSLLNLL